MDSPRCSFGNIGPAFTCVPTSSLCKNRSKYVFWDEYHPTNSANELIANELIKETWIFNWESRWRGSSFRSTCRCSVSIRFIVMTNATCYYIRWYLVCSWVLTMSFPYNVLLWYNDQLTWNSLDCRKRKLKYEIKNTNFWVWKICFRSAFRFSCKFGLYKP